MGKAKLRPKDKCWVQGPGPSGQWPSWDRKQVPQYRACIFRHPSVSPLTAAESHRSQKGPEPGSGPGDWRMLRTWPMEGHCWRCPLLGLRHSDLLPTGRRTLVANSGCGRREGSCLGEGRKHRSPGGRLKRKAIPGGRCLHQAVSTRGPGVGPGCAGIARQGAGRCRGSGAAARGNSPCSGCRMIIIPQGCGRLSGHMSFWGHCPCPWPCLFLHHQRHAELGLPVFHLLGECK